MQARNIKYNQKNDLLNVLGLISITNIYMVYISYSTSKLFSSAYESIPAFST